MTTQANQASSSAAQPEAAAASIHRPEADVPDKPELKVKRPTREADAAEALPAVRGGTLFQQQGEQGESDAPPKAVRHPGVEHQERYSAGGIHQPAPPDEQAEHEALATVGGVSRERQFSTGFLLGVALIVITLVLGISVVRLGKRVGALERRLARLEAPEGAAVERPAP